MIVWGWKCELGLRRRVLEIVEWSCVFVGRFHACVGYWCNFVDFRFFHAFAFELVLCCSSFLI